MQRRQLPSLKVALAVLEQGGEYLLQRRNGGPEIGAAGMLGLFGGKIEDETPLDAVCREVEEEVGIVLRPSSVVDLGKVTVTADYKRQPISIKARVFRTNLDDMPPVSQVNEGGLVRLNPQMLVEARAELTPATLATFEQLIGVEF